MMFSYMTPLTNSYMTGILRKDILSGKQCHHKIWKLSPSSIPPPPSPPLPSPSISHLPPSPSLSDLHPPSLTLSPP